jgi:hypothetical protein
MPAMFAPLEAGLAARRLTAAALIVWLAGVGCFFGCEMSVSASTADEHRAATRADSCPAFAGHDCCHKANSAAAALRPAPPEETTTCCPLARQATSDPARKVSASDAPVAAAGSRLGFAPDTRTLTLLASHRPRVPDRGSTHLRCCVFLI